VFLGIAGFESWIGHFVCNFCWFFQMSRWLLQLITNKVFALPTFRVRCGDPWFTDTYIKTCTNTCTGEYDMVEPWFPVAVMNVTVATTIGLVSLFALFWFTRQYQKLNNVYEGLLDLREVTIDDSPKSYFDDPLNERVTELETDCSSLQERVDMIEEKLDSMGGS